MKERKNIYYAGGQPGPMTSPARRATTENKPVNVAGKRKTIEPANFEIGVAPKRVALEKKPKGMSESQKRKKAEKLERERLEQANYVFNGFGGPSDPPKRVDVPCKTVFESEENNQQALDSPEVTPLRVVAEDNIASVIVMRDAIEQGPSVTPTGIAFAAEKNDLALDGVANQAPSPKLSDVGSDINGNINPAGLAVDGFMNPAFSPKKSYGREVDQEGADGSVNPSDTPKKAVVAITGDEETGGKEPVDVGDDKYASGKDAGQGDAPVDGFENPGAPKKSVGKRKSKTFAPPVVTSRRLAKMKEAASVRMEDQVDFYLPAGTKRIKGDTAVIFIHGGYITRMRLILI
jgi:hypothetical protein